MRKSELYWLSGLILLIFFINPRARYKVLFPFPSPPSQNKSVVVSFAASGETEEAQSKSSPTTVNCTVSYVAQCVAYKKCRMTCTSMGAHSYRWFRDGCCECVGPYCLNYGINESRFAYFPLDFFLSIILPVVFWSEFHYSSFFPGAPVALSLKTKSMRRRNYM